MNNNTTKTSIQDDNILEIKDLKVYFKSDEGLLKAVDGVNFSIAKGKSVGLVGESGSGKSVTAKAVMKLIPPDAVIDGQVVFKEKGSGEQVDILSLKQDSKALRDLRGDRISMIFQDPMTSFSPVHTVGNQLTEVLFIHRPEMSKKEAWDVCTKMLEKVGISNAPHRMTQYASELSGGMRQRAMIAMSLLCSPALLIADEPTTALDVTVQAQVLDLIDTLKDELGSSILFITHDLGVIANSVEQVAVMYLGKIVEFGDVKDIFKNPLHPYTQNLMQSIPQLGKTTGKRLYTIPGSVPVPIDLPNLCAYRDRCSQVTEECSQRMPIETIKENEHRVLCLLQEK